MGTVEMEGQATYYEVIEYENQLYYFAYVVSPVALNPNSSTIHVGNDSSYRTTVLKCIEANISKFN